MPAVSPVPSVSEDRHFSGGSWRKGHSLSARRSREAGRGSAAGALRLPRAACAPGLPWTELSAEKSAQGRVDEETVTTYSH